MKILLIDDSKLQRWAVQKILTGAGHIVVQAGDGKEGLRLALEGKADVILLDMLLPLLDGPAVLDAIKKNPATAHTPVVVLTGLSEKNEAKLIDAGAAAFYQKSMLGTRTGATALLEMVSRVSAKLQAVAKPGATSA
jgi:CheY-like chemotaxis protein